MFKFESYPQPPPKSSAVLQLNYPHERGVGCCYPEAEGQKAGKVTIDVVKVTRDPVGSNQILQECAKRLLFIGFMREPDAPDLQKKRSSSYVRRAASEIIPPFHE
ncbi:Hypothetical protein NTJ_16168 [Nesidiocoris tenuis]|uniref:Uncharacterized protein n=1 Tax=Nesidiocoris tenuis TaxID=355587 RepID=A0ABN7BHN7_9HEMI|nr:Hypothetical protein NTJ_16168 [Nesidiocoris tenuis]